MNAELPQLDQSAEWLRAARRIVVFSGAGVSAESGIPTFRDAGGLWSRFPPERFAQWEGLMHTAATNPRQFAEFVLAVAEPIAAAEPNAGHRAVAALEGTAHVEVVTQNIDRLHQQAGSQRVHEVHGSLFDIVTHEGRKLREVSRAALRELVNSLRKVIDDDPSLPQVLEVLQPVIGLSGADVHRPDVVLFGEAMHEPDWSRALAATRRCDLMIAVGTSGEVFPAAMLPAEARAAGAKVIGVDPESGASADAWLKGPSAALLPALVQAAFGPPSQ